MTDNADGNLQPPPAPEDKAHNEEVRRRAWRARRARRARRADRNGKS